MAMRRAKRQMSARAERSGNGQGEALSVPASDEAPRPRHEPEDTGPGLLIQLKQWRRGTTIYRELLARRARPEVALIVAGNSRRLWRNSGMLLNGVLDLSWADQLEIPRLC